MIRVLVIGDVFGSAGVDYLKRDARLARFRDSAEIDAVIVNAENATDGKGLTPSDAQALLSAGADILTGGNHSFRFREMNDMYDADKRILRPANMPDSAPGTGYGYISPKGYRLLVVNLLGTVYTTMPPADSPFLCADRILKREEGRYDMAVIDIHAETTSEKMAVARYFDSRVSAVFGTHTHVATADAQVLPGGTGYITDVGMCGSKAGILGVKTENILHSFLEKTPVRFDCASGEVSADGAIFTLDESRGRCSSAEAVIL